VICLPKLEKIQYHLFCLVRTEKLAEESGLRVENRLLPLPQSSFLGRNLPPYWIKSPEEYTTPWNRAGRLKIEVVFS
jgi:hypothetical protein